ncbi:DoxX-like family protein [Kitasatospora phosalacinea]|uniref:DoxX-like family protein n=1 Tax=Kitasatospora phosalacinea TaxID=2065 RepID=UPI00365EF478
MVDIGRTRLPALAVALMWWYEGFWCKVFPGRADQRAIVEGLPLLPAGAAGALLVAIGLAEVALGAWVLLGHRPYAAAVVQTVLVVGFNTGGLLVGAQHIPEPGRLVVQDLALLALIWLVAARRPTRGALRGNGAARELPAR